MITSLVILVSLLMVSTAMLLIYTQNLIRAVLLLSAHLLLTAFLFVGLNASFLAMVQILLYTGGALILGLFAVMLHQSPQEERYKDQTLEEKPLLSPLYAFFMATAFFSALSFAISQSDFPVEKQIDHIPLLSSQSGQAKEIGLSLYTQHILSFELLSLVLLAVLIGSLVIARKSDEVLS